MSPGHKSENSLFFGVFYLILIFLLLSDGNKFRTIKYSNKIYCIFIT